MNTRKKRNFSRLFPVLCLVSASAFAAPPQAAPNATAPVPNPTTTAKPNNGRPTLEQYIQDALMREGEDGSADHKKLLETEVYPFGSLYVLNYKVTPDGTNVQVDGTKLKNFLKFSPKNFRDAGTVTICVLVRPQSDCMECEQYKTAVQNAIMNKLTARGFSPRPGPAVASDFTADSELKGERAFEEFVLRSVGLHAEDGATNAVRCDGALYSEITRGPGSDDHEAVTASIRVDSRLEMRTEPSVKRRASSEFPLNVAKVEAPDEVPVAAPAVPPPAEGAADALEETETPAAAAPAKPVVREPPKADVTNQIVARVTADLFGAKSMSAGAFVGNTHSSEQYVRLDGVDNFTTYNRFKQKLLDSFPGLLLEERMVGPGTFQFAVIGNTPLDLIASRIQRIDWGTQKPMVNRLGANEISVMLR